MVYDTPNVTEGGSTLATFLGETTDISYHLQHLVKDTRERLYLISPYLKLNDRFRQELEDVLRFRPEIMLVFKEHQLKTADLNWLAGLPSIHTSACENLHAKCYLNENEAIITSMNLYEFSQEHNREMGIHVSREQDPDLYGAILAGAKKVIRGSEEIRITVSQVPKTMSTAEPKPRDEPGYCIRCHAAIKLDPKVPYCKDCYKVWKTEKHKNNDYAENFCHVCGKPNGSSLNKPSCYDCYKSKKDELEFPTPSGK